MRRFQRVLGVFFVGVMILIPGCKEKVPDSSRPATSALFTIGSEKTGAIAHKQAGLERDTNPVISASDLGSVVAGNTMFAIDLYRKLAKDEGNTFFSPYSISLALGMTWGGARGETGNEIARTLHFSLAQNKQHAGLNALDLSLKRSAKISGFELNIVNQLWGDRTCAILPDYLMLAGNYYGAGIRFLDFRNQPEPSRVIINEWVSEQTKERIKDLIPQEAIDDSTMLVLTNAIYFKANWEYPFDAANTFDGSFYLGTGGREPADFGSRTSVDAGTDTANTQKIHGVLYQLAHRPRCGFNKLTGNCATVKFMSQRSAFSSVKTADYQAVSLPYKGRAMSMIVIMPWAGKMKTVEDSLSPAFLASVVKGLTTKEIRLRLPKFKFTTPSMDLSFYLELLGMQLPFMRNVADFSGIDGKKDLFIANVFHKAFIAVDEKESEAAAATAVAMGFGGGFKPDPTPLYIFDHSFIFLILDNKTGTIIFMGKINDPAKE